MRAARSFPPIVSGAVPCPQPLCIPRGKELFWNVLPDALGVLSLPHNPSEVMYNNAHLMATKDVFSGPLERSIISAALPANDSPIGDGWEPMTRGDPPASYDPVVPPAPTLSPLTGSVSSRGITQPCKPEIFQLEMPEIKPRILCMQK